MRRAWGVLVVATALVLTACTGGDSASSDSAPGSIVEALSPTNAPAPGAVATAAPSTGDTSSTDSPRPVTSSTTAPRPTAGVTTTTVMTAASLADALEAAERGIRDTSLDDATRAAHGRAQQDVYRAAGADRALLTSLPELVGDDVRTAVAFNVAARIAVLDHAARRSREGATSEPPVTLPAWTIVEPRPIDELLSFYREAEELTGVPWSYLAAINFVETRMGRIVGASSAGAVGPMQFLPSTWEACCTGDVHDPHDAIVGAARYLAMNGAPGDMVRALEAYNPNDGYVGSVIAYAANIAADERAYVGYHAWEVYVTTNLGPVHLPVGYAASAPVDVATYLDTSE